MLFTSGVFVIFFTAFLILYWLAQGSVKHRNWLILAGSLLFYGWWQPEGDVTEFSFPVLEFVWHLRFLGLLLFTTLLDFAAGLLMQNSSPRTRKMILAASVSANLGVLCFFKYGGFFSESIGAAFTSVGWNWERGGWNIILPVGISFYTFQSMSYTIDVYRGIIQPTRKLVEFVAFVSFFPQLVAGPIERAGSLLPQFSRTLVINRSMVEEGIWLILWGFFKKVVIADSLAPLVEMVFEGHHHTFWTVALATIAFGIQIYCDFSGYSDIARGTARLLGFELMWNFSIPYSASNMREFWSKWHISLSTWLRDYVYVTFGGNRHGRTRTYINLLATMVLGGLWHGAGWNFILWGFWHGFALVLNRAWQSAGLKLNKVTGWALTMITVFFGWFLFRAASFDKITTMLSGVTNFATPAWIGSYLLTLVVFLVPLFLIELIQYKRGNLLAPLSFRSKAFLQGLLVVAVVVFWKKEKVPFIYFQF